MNPAIYFICRNAMHVFARVWFRTRRPGADRVPRTGGVLIVGNHASHLDPPLVGAFTKRKVYFLARSSLGSTRLGSWFLRSLGTIFVDRDAPSRASIQAAIDVLASGAALVMFPEGTRTRDGRVGSFLRGFELLVRRAGVPVVPVGLRGPFRAMPRGTAFPRPAKIELHYGEPIPASDILEQGGFEALRRRVAELAGAELAPDAVRPEPEAQTESSSSGEEPRGGRSEPVRRPSDGPTAASNH